MIINDLIIEIKRRRDVAKYDLDTLGHYPFGAYNNEIAEVCGRRGHVDLLKWDEDTVSKGIRVLVDVCLEEYKQLEITIYHIEKIMGKDCE